MKSCLQNALVISCLFFTFTLSAQMSESVMVGGEAMYPKKNIVQNAVHSEVHTTLVAAVKAAGLVETLQSEGPFTVFAPVNDAFENLPDGTVENLLKEENKSKLTGVLTYHVVPGKLDMSDLKKRVKKGMNSLKTVNGGELKLMLNGPNNLVITDENGRSANIIVYDVYQSNGVIHTLDSVLLPSS